QARQHLVRGATGVQLPNATSHPPGAAMSDTRYPYATHLDIRFPALALVDMQGEYHWHVHEHDDEFFFVLEGRFLIDLEDRSVELLPRQGFVVPKGVVHRTRAPERAVIL